jgi:rRNA processing protein Gar1
MTTYSHNGQVGDVIVIEEHHLGEGRRIGEILDVFGPGAREHYRVRWDDGRESLFYPSNDAVIHRHQRAEEEPVLVHEP